MKELEQNDSFVILDEDGNEDPSVITPTPPSTPPLNQETMLVAFKSVSAETQPKFHYRALKNIIFSARNTLAYYCCPPQNKEKQDAEERDPTSLKSNTCSYCW